MGLPAFLVTDHERVYRLSFWAKATGNPKPRPHITFQDEDNNYEYIYGDFVQLSAFWHQYHVDLVVPFKLRGYISPRRWPPGCRPSSRRPRSHPP